MNNKPQIETLLYRIRELPSVMMVLGVIVALVAVFGNVATSYADAKPGGDVANPIVRAVDIAKPSVVRIITALPSHLVVHLTQGDVTFPQANGAQGGNGNQGNGGTQNNNDGYLLELSGSGTFITSKGDILTADHVVNPPKDQQLTQFLNKAAAPDVANYINQHNTPGATQVTPDQVEQQLDSGQLKSTATFDTPQSEVFLSTDYSGPLSAPDFKSLPAGIQAPVDKIEKESTFAEKDVAIVHAAFNVDTPSVQLGDSSNVQQQDELTIIGFPGNGDVSTRPTDLLTSSVNKINVSSIKTTDNGAPVIQVGGNVEHGDSGGPALDSNGKVVGIVSFGANGPGSTSFLQASNSARDLVQQLGLDTTPGQFQKQWEQAFNTYSSNTPGHWHQAQKQFEQLAKSYPDFKAVTRYLDYAISQAKTEPLPQSTRPTNSNNKPTSPIGGPVAIPAMVWTVVAIGGVVLLAVLLFGVVIWQRKKKPGAGTGKKQPSLPAGSVAPGGQPPARADGMAAFGAPAQARPPLPQSPRPMYPVQAGQPPQRMPSARPAQPGVGAPPAQSMQPARPVQPAQPIPGGPPAGGATPSGSFTTLRVWPCGHMNRLNARFCSICGEPAPEPPTIRRRIEQ